MARRVTVASLRIAALFVVAVSAGPAVAQDPPAPVPVFSALDRPAPFDFAAARIDTGRSSFSGIDYSSARVARSLSGGNLALVARARNDVVCLLVVRQKPREPVASRRNPGTVIRFRQPLDSSCGPKRDVGLGALAVRPSVAARSLALLVPDGASVRIPGAKLTPVVNNVAQVPLGTRSVFVRVDGRTSRLGVKSYPSNVLLPKSRPLPSPVVPDVTGLDQFEAAGVLQVARLNDVVVSARPVAGVAPGTVIEQSATPNTSLPARTPVALTLASPVGPNGVRQQISGSTAFRAIPPHARDRRTFRSMTLGQFVGEVTEVVFVTTSSQAARASWFEFGRARKLIVGLGLNETATRRLARRASGAAAVVADPEAVFAATLGVTDAPTTVVLDRTGRLVDRIPALPMGTRGGPNIVIDAVGRSLAAEPRPADAIPEIPTVWYLRGRAPLPVADVPPFFRSASYFSCTVVPERVWEFGPSPGGYRAWIALGPAAYNGAAPTTVQVVSKSSPRGRFAGSTGCGASLNDQRLARAVVYPLGSFQGGRFARHWFIVRRGYDRAVVPGKVFPVRNGLLVVQGRGLPRSFTLRGSAGTREVPLATHPGLR